MAILHHRAAAAWPGDPPLDDVLLFVLEPGLGGAWTEKQGRRELIRFGYPPDARSAWLRALDPPRKDHNCASLAIERMVFARQISHVLVSEALVDAVASRGVKAHPAVKLIRAWQYPNLQSALRDFPTP